MFCSQCGAKAAEMARFCSNCGAALDNDSANTEPETIPEVAVASDPKIHTTETTDKGPSGIGGWLMLLVLGMMVLGPLMGAAMLGGNLMKEEQMYPHLVELQDWTTYKSFAWLAFIALASVSFYGGLGLARGREWSVVSRAKAVLWINGPGSSILIGTIIPAGMWGSQIIAELGPQIIGNLVGSVVVASIWTAYLSRSKRVHNTYGETASPNAHVIIWKDALKWAGVFVGIALVGIIVIIGIPQYSEHRNRAEAVRQKNSGNEYLERKQHDKAIEAYQQALTLDPQSTVWWNLGVAYSRSGRHLKAIEAYRQALNSDPNEPTLWNNLGLAYSGSGDNEGAIKAYKQALSLDPNDTDILWNLGAIYMDMDAIDKVKEVYLQLLKMDSEKGSKFMQEIMIGSLKRRIWR